MIRPPLGMRQPMQPPQQPNYVQGGGVQGGGSNIMGQMAKMGLKTALSGSPMAPLAGVVGGLFNQGGMVGADAPATRGNPMSPDTFINGQIKSEHYYPNFLNKGGKVSWWKRALGSNPNRKKAAAGRVKPGQKSIAEQINWGGKNKKNMGGMIYRNMGGPLAAHPNPNGYNEGGAVGETPIKKVMDEQKLDQQAVAFERDQVRKQEAHDMAMKQKQQQFQMAQKMKKESAMTNKKPAQPKGPLGGKK